MQLIENIQEYKNIVRWNKLRFAQTHSNCVALPTSFEGYIRDKRFYAEKYADGIAFFADEDKYLKLFYFWNAEKPFADFQQEKPVVVEVLNANGNRDAYLSQYEPSLFQAGFKPYRKNNQFSADMWERKAYFEEAYSCKTEELKKKGINLVLCQDLQSFNQAVDLWDAYLEMTDIPYDHRTMDDNVRILNAVTKEGRVAATVWWSESGQSSEIRHVVTHPDFSRNGLATVLEMGWILHCFETGIKRWTTWVNEENGKSRKLHEKLGFCPNGRSSVQYILEQRRNSNG